MLAAPYPRPQHRGPRYPPRPIIPILSLMALFGRHRFAPCRAVDSPGHRRRGWAWPPLLSRRRGIEFERPLHRSFPRCGGEADAFYGGSPDVGAATGSGADVANPPRRQPVVPGQPSPFEYVPVTALDDYGQCAQLRHAMESASRFGTPVLACICLRDDRNDDGDEGGDDENIEARAAEDAIVVCSLQRPRPGVVAPPAGFLVTATRPAGEESPSRSAHRSVKGMVRALATRDDSVDPALSPGDFPRHALHAAAVSTGIRPDADFLLRQLQIHVASRYWFRYDTLPPTTAMVKMARDVLLDFMGYEWADELSGNRVSGGIGSAAPSYGEGDDDEGGSKRAGRPLGVCTFLLGLDSARPSITVIQANGSSQQYVAHAMGMGSQLANEKLSQKWRRRMGREEARDMLVEILGDVARERGWLAVPDGGVEAMDGGDGKIDSGLTVACETVTWRGIGIEFLTL